MKDIEHLKIMDFCDGWCVEHRNIWVEEDATYRTITQPGFDTRQEAEDWARAYEQMGMRRASNTLE